MRGWDNVLLTLAVLSSEQLAISFPQGLQQTAFTSSVCPLKVYMGVASGEETLHTKIVLSDEQVTNVSESFQSTSRTGAACREYAFTTVPSSTSHTNALLS